jgi:hypothetical protein
MALTVMGLTMVGLTMMGQTKGMAMVITEDPTLGEDMTESLAMVEDIMTVLILMAMESMLLMLGDTMIIIIMHM